MPANFSGISSLIERQPMRLELFGTLLGMLAPSLYRETGGDLWQGVCKFAVTHKLRFLRWKKKKTLKQLAFLPQRRNGVCFHLVLSVTGTVRPPLQVEVGKVLSG